MTNENEPTETILPPIKKLDAFSEFFSGYGMKRLDGAVFGLLTLTPTPLSSEQIENHLGVSQGSVSSSLKSLSLYGAIKTQTLKEKRVKIHTATMDSLEIVASVLRKREHEKLKSLKMNLNDMMLDLNLDGVSYNDPRTQRIKSLLSTCEIAESVMNFIVGLSESQVPKKYPQVVQKLPKVLALITQGTEPLMALTSQFKKDWTSKLKDGLFKFRGDHDDLT